MLVPLHKVPSLAACHIQCLDVDKKFSHQELPPYLVSKIEDWLNSYNLMLGNFSAFVYAPHTTGIFHTDVYRPPSDIPKINWIIGSGILSIYKKFEDCKTNKKLTELNFPYVEYPLEDAKEENMLATFEGSGIFMMNAAYPHVVTSIIDEPRYCFSLTPAKRRGRLLSWDEATEIFS